MRSSLLLGIAGCLFMLPLCGQPARNAAAFQRQPVYDPIPPQENQVREPGFKVFQFPANQIPRIDGKFDDWDIVPDSYAVTMDEMWDDSRKHESLDKNSIDIKVKVGWVKGENRLYFYYEAKDDYWHFSEPGLSNDIFEVVVDGDLSGGPHVDEFRVNQDVTTRLDAFFDMQNVHAQNYHIFTPPAAGKEWTMVWGVQQWLMYLPYANHAYSYDFKPGESGTLKFEFFITPFDYASPEGPEKSVESKLFEGKKIGLCWAVIDHDRPGGQNNGFWNLSKGHQMFGLAEMERLFTLMPLEKHFHRPLEAAWSYQVVDNTRIVAFHDESYGEITSWLWDFGDGTTSTEQNPVHVYAQDNNRITVTLTVKGPAGEEKLSKVWGVMVRDREHPNPINYR